MTQDGRTHHPECWRDHLDCAVREVERLRALVQRDYDIECEAGGHPRCRCHSAPSPCCNCEYLRVERLRARQLPDELREEARRLLGMAHNVVDHPWITPATALLRRIAAIG